MTYKPAPPHPPAMASGYDEPRARPGVPFEGIYAVIPGRWHGPVVLLALAMAAFSLVVSLGLWR